jgi:hypothetical protein
LLFQYRRDERGSAQSKQVAAYRRRIMGHIYCPVSAYTMHASRI